MIRNILASSRYFVIIAVLGAFVSSITMFLYSGIAVFWLIVGAFRSGVFSESGAKHLAVGFIEMIDFFLLGTVLYIIAMGLYELFIDDQLPMPKWLHIESLDNLKEKLVTVIIVMLAASFLGEVVEWTGGNDIFYLGAAIALLISALALLLWVGGFGDHKDDKSATPGEGEHAAPD